ncbi:uncharacterized protein [Asterias amurensis]|uniref:uncharacterized protein isoform X1 n=1 Tax=Asterias amurensis TaxID=7602 RepID=UPI003AB7A63C
MDGDGQRRRLPYKRFLEEEDLTIPRATIIRRQLDQSQDEYETSSDENLDHRDGEIDVLDQPPAPAMPLPERELNQQKSSSDHHSIDEGEAHDHGLAIIMLNNDEVHQNLDEDEYFPLSDSEDLNFGNDGNIGTAEAREQDMEGSDQEEEPFPVSDSDSDNDIYADPAVHEEHVDGGHEQNRRTLHVENGDQPISSEGTDLNRMDSLLAVLTYAVKHHISGVALQDLIDLINMHCPNSLPTSKYLFGNSFTGYKGVTEFHFYCSCQVYLGSDDSCPDHCQHCNKAFDKDTSLKNGNFFMVMPLFSQLKHVMETDGLGSLLMNRVHTTDGNNICDIQDGAMYRKLVDDGLLSDNKNISLLWNTDGVPIFKSSKFSIWPVLCSINELPMKLRRENVLLTALWFGDKKPDMNIFLKPFIDECNSLSSTGFVWKLNNNVVVSRVFCLVCTVDTVARPMLQKFIQFNGFYGCGFCKHKGDYVTNSMKYLYKHPQPPLREEKETKRASILADESRRSIDGVKGVSILSFLTYFNIISSFIPDYMHAVCLGTVRRIVAMWLNPSNSSNEWYLGRRSADICARLKFIQATKEITRLPRSLSELKFWKANEWRSFLLYSPLILKDILPAKYLAHWSMLACAIFHLNTCKISKQTLQWCDFLLHKFVLYMEPLYGATQATFNVHLLLHMSDSVNNWGPLWGTSAFMFEDFNGCLKTMFSGTRYVPQQIFQSICRFQDIKRNAPLISSERTACYVSRLLGGPRFIKNVLKIVRGDTTLVCLGLPKTLYVTQSFRYAIETLLGQHLITANVNCYDRFILQNALLTSRSYSSKFRRNNSIIDVRGMLAEIVGLISFKNHVCGAGIDCDCLQHVMLLVQELEIEQTLRNEFDDELGCQVGFIHAISRGAYVALHSDVQIRKAMLVKVENTDYVIKLPNTCEGD